MPKFTAAQIHALSRLAAYRRSRGPEFYVIKPVLGSQPTMDKLLSMGLVEHTVKVKSYSLSDAGYRLTEAGVAVVTALSL